MVTPYLTESLLQAAPTGAPWEIVPYPQAPNVATSAELANIAWRATSIVDSSCHQVLRATVDTDPLTGPGGPRVGLQPGTLNGQIVMRRWPVIDVLAIQTSSTRSWPRSWTTVPSTDYEVTRPLLNRLSDAVSQTMPDGGWGITLAPGVIPPLWCGRNSTQLLVSYTNGWPHASLTQPATAAASVLHVDDVTGFTGASAFAYDGASTEIVQVQSVAATSPLSLPNGVGTAQTGPGTVTLVSPLANAHAAGVLISALPPNVIWATVLIAAAQVLSEGATSVAIQNIAGSLTSGGKGVDELRVEAEIMLNDYKRIA